jgi:hypothetical protein
MDSFAVAQSLESPAGPKLNQLFAAEGQWNDVSESQSSTLAGPATAATVKSPPSEVSSVGKGTRIAVESTNEQNSAYRFFLLMRVRNPFAVNPSFQSLSLA